MNFYTPRNELNALEMNAQELQSSVTNSIEQAQFDEMQIRTSSINRSLFGEEEWNEISIESMHQGKDSSNHRHERKKFLHVNVLPSEMPTLESPISARCSFDLELCTPQKEGDDEGGWLRNALSDSLMSCEQTPLQKSDMCHSPVCDSPPSCSRPMEGFPLLFTSPKKTVFQQISFHSPFKRLQRNSIFQSPVCDSPPSKRQSPGFQMRSPPVYRGLFERVNSDDTEDVEMKDDKPSTPQFTRQLSFMEKKDFTVPALQRNASMLTYAVHYHTHELLGRGDYGEVWSATHHLRQDEWYALKIGTKLFKGSKQRDIYIQEVEMVSKLQKHPHPNIVKYHRAWQDEGRFWIAMELCTGGTLKKIIEFGDLVPLEQVDKYCHGILSGLSHIHSANLLHLDLKPDNIFLDAESGIKIGDFGLCVYADKWDEQEGDKRYLAPEVLAGHASFSADIFSAGLIFYQMLVGIKDLPGDGEQWHTLRDGSFVMNVDEDRRSSANISRTMLNPQPHLRPTAQQLISSD